MSMVEDAIVMIVTWPSVIKSVQIVWILCIDIMVPATKHVSTLNSVKGMVSHACTC